MRNFLLGVIAVTLMAVAGRQFNGADEVIFSAATATPGNATLAAPLVRGLIAQNASTITITNSFVTDANAHVDCTLEFTDSTLTFIKSVIPSASSIAVTGNANCANAGGCQLSCLVHNAH